jgi:hypothetical protein
MFRERTVKMLAEKISAHYTYANPHDLPDDLETLQNVVRYLDIEVAVGEELDRLMGVEETD